MSEKEKVDMNDSIEYIVRCHCGDKSDHVIHIAQYNLTDEFSDAKLGHCVVSTRLDPCKNWYQRIWVAVKYIFGVNAYQYIDTIVDVDILKDVVLELQDTRTDEEKQTERDNRSEVKVV